MSNGSSAIVSGVLLAALSSAATGGFLVYTDVQLMKERVANIETMMNEREQTTKRFTEMMNQMDKTIAIQTEAVNTLKTAVNRLESAAIATNYQPYSKEDFKP